MKRFSSFVALASALFLSSICAHAQVLLNDTFSDGNRSGQTLPSSAAWFISSSTSSNASVNGDGVLTTNSGLSITAYFASAGSPVTLAAGDTLVLTFQIAYNAATDPTGNTALKVGLFNSNNSTRISADGTNNIFAPYSGYAVTYGYTTTSAVRERPTDLANTALLTSTTGYTVVGSSSANFGITDTPLPNYYNGSFAITRTGDGQLSFTFSLTQQSNPANSWSYTVADASPVTFGFDTVSFATTSGTNQLIDNVKVELIPAAIPEPSTYAALAGAVAFLGVWIRRRRR